ncbi:hypothetical protein OsJ_26210 [Oryza sativa Japonica Group]|uniref:Uncharacterized protein n=1 Tax=Oryza sativa subsp. japonica TaxID=39947 RepID=A3BQ34_ORYSJ|nr:hypothetical protein OsJ_26210 [Oryza sativa Japonica Group]
MDGTSSVSARTASSLSSSSSSLDDGGRGRPSAGRVDAGAAVAEALPVPFPVGEAVPEAAPLAPAADAGAAVAAGCRSARRARSPRRRLPPEDEEEHPTGTLMSHVVSWFSGAARPMPPVHGNAVGPRKGRVALALQETPRCLPTLVIELAIQTNALLRELANPAGARIVLETRAPRAIHGRRRRQAPEGAAAAGRGGVDHVLQREEDRARGAAGGDGRRPRGAGDAAPRLHGRRRAPRLQQVVVVVVSVAGEGGGGGGRRGGLHARLLRPLRRLARLRVALHDRAPGRRHRPGARHLLRQAMTTTTTYSPARRRCTDQSIATAIARAMQSKTKGAS